MSFMEDTKVVVKNKEISRMIRWTSEVPSAIREIRKTVRLLNISRSTEITLTEGCCIYLDNRKTAKRAVGKVRNDMEIH